MKLVREHINEKFQEKSDPIRDMGIGPFPTNFEPMYVMIKSFPGAKYPVGTVFGKQKDSNAWSLAALYKGKTYYDGYEEKKYFKPWVGEFFEKY